MTKTIMNILVLTYNPVTLGEWISGVIVLARANWNVVLHSTLSVQSARAGARISALFSNASLLTGTLGVDHAFGSAVGWSTDVAREAGARWAVSV